MVGIMPVVQDTTFPNETLFPNEQIAVAKRRHLLWYLEESVQELEDKEILVLVSKCLEAFGFKMQTV